ncbi:uncharacterized protein LOC121283378 isoform X3 [Carcharodon carcharias]|uniref:uncharacterized protein LOC121283378 isoform X3 n=1 Tax=Carcharodon carcharias TaxID=13397 RepID=UPI001B7E5031|nr:uncharacterized protein LOC121283378 isoform X3 [Carcharodon carcharias]
MGILALCVIVSSISLTETLELEIFPSPLEISANQDALLMCKFNKPESDLTHIAVRWVLTSQSNQKDVYVFDGGEHSPKREGAKIFDEALRKGNASLYLPNVQLNEEGKYTCIVFVTPHKEEKSSVMQVSAQPKVSMSRQEITSVNGAEHFLVCDVQEFFPKQLNISWFILSNGKMEYVTQSQSTDDLVTNSDGTFSVSSKIRIEPTLGDGTNYRCVVKHKTLLRNFTLDADSVEEQIPIGPIIGTICGFVVLCAVCLGFYFWNKKHKRQGKAKEIEDDTGRALIEKQSSQSPRAPPSINDIKKPCEIIDGEETNLSWEVTVFSPEVVKIVTSVKRKGEQKAKKLFHWEISAGQLSGPKRVTTPFKNMCDLCEKDDSFSAEVPELQRTSDGFLIPCSVTLCPDVSKDDDADLIVEVKQDTSEGTCTESTVLKVTAGQQKSKESEDDTGSAVLEMIPHNKRAPPSISDIKKSFEIIDGEETNLSWKVTVFSPEVVNIVTSVKRKGEQKAKKLFHWEISAGQLSGPKRITSPFKNVCDLCEKDDSFSAEVPELQRTSDGFLIPCSVTLCPDVSKDDGAELIVEVKQDTSEGTCTENTVLKVTAGQQTSKESEDDTGSAVLEMIPHNKRAPPSISDIKKPCEIIDGEETNLSWEVTVFIPEVVNIVTSVKRKGEQKAKKLFHWEISAGQLSGPKRVTSPFKNVCDLCEKDDSFSAEVPELQRTSDGFLIPCSVTLCPDVSKDDDAELIVEVKQDTSEGTCTESTVLKVTAGQQKSKESEDDTGSAVLEMIPHNKRAPPSISDIKKPFEIIDGEETNLSWKVTVFSPEVVNIVTSVKRKGEQKAKKLFHWEISAGQLSGRKRITSPFKNVCDLCEKDDSFSAEVPELQRTSDGFLIPCSVTLCPDVSKDDGAELIVEVKQDTSEGTCTENTVLKVTAGQQKSKESEDDTGSAVLEMIPHNKRDGEETNLSWEVTVFIPEVVNIVTSVKRKGEQKAKKLFHWEISAGQLSGPKRVTSPFKNVCDLCEKDDSFSAEVPELQRTSDGFLIPCSVTLCPDVSKDDDAELIVEVKQDTSEGTCTESTVLKVTAGQQKSKESEDDTGSAVLEMIPHNKRAPPSISDIKKPFEIIDGEETNLSWKVTVFSPEVVNIVTSVKRKGEQKAKKLFHWEISAGQLSGPKRITSPFKNVCDLCEKDDSFSAEVPELQRTSDGFLIPCSVTLCPDVSKDDGAELIVEVKQDTSEGTCTENTVLKVTAGQQKSKESEDDTGSAVLEMIPHNKRGQQKSKESEDDSGSAVLEMIPHNKRAPPSISDIKKPCEIIDGEETNLSWEVAVFIPEVVNIVTSVKRKGEQKAKKLFHWEISAGQLSGPKRITSPFKNVCDLCEKDDSFSAEVPELQRTSDGFLIPCSITLCPDVSKDDGAELIVEVKQDTSERTCTENTVLKVTAGQQKSKESEDDTGSAVLEMIPHNKRGQQKSKESEDDTGSAVLEMIPHNKRAPLSISDIQKPDEIIAGEKTNLSWEVNLFSPGMVNIVTSVKRKGEQKARKLFHWEMPAENFSGPKRLTVLLKDLSDLSKKDDSFSAEVPELQHTSDSGRIPCSVTLCPDVSKDDGAELIIEVKQDTSEETSSKSTVLKVIAGPPKLKEAEDDGGQTVEKMICHVEREAEKTCTGEESNTEETMQVTNNHLRQDELQEKYNWETEVEISRESSKSSMGEPKDKGEENSLKAPNEKEENPSP